MSEEAPSWATAATNAAVGAAVKNPQFVASAVTAAAAHQADLNAPSGAVGDAAP